MNPPKKEAFELRLPLIQIADILPVRKITEQEQKQEGYKSIAASIKEIGMLEPLVIYPQANAKGKYILLDGHLRMEILKGMGTARALCIVSTEDEAYSYNHHVNRLSPIQGNGMILRAIKNGVPPERIAAALHVDIKKIKASMNLLHGIHPEVVEMLNAKQVTPGALVLLKKVSPVRQLEMAELMISTNTFTVAYVRALVTNTPKEKQLNPKKTQQTGGLTPEDVARMENESGNIEQDYKIAKESFSVDVYHLTLARGYIRKLLDNAKIVKFLAAKHAGMLTEFQTLAALDAL
jgi:ParB-like chromosome segregation protein Spo0J